MKIILDTSAAISVVMRGEKASVLTHQLEIANAVISPQFARVEMSNVLWKYVRWQDMPIDAALQHIDEAAELVDLWLDDASLIPQALNLAARYEHPVYDLLYVVAAMQQGAKLMSLDRKLLRLANEIDANTVLAM